MLLVSFMLSISPSNSMCRFCSKLFNMHVSMITFFNFVCYNGCGLGVVKFCSPLLKILPTPVNISTYFRHSQDDSIEL